MPYDIIYHLNSSCTNESYRVLFASKWHLNLSLDLLIHKQIQWDLLCSLDQTTVCKSLPHDATVAASLVFFEGFQSACPACPTGLPFLNRKVMGSVLSCLLL